jgi:hypothetical protein
LNETRQHLYIKGLSSFEFLVDKHFIIGFVSYVEEIGQSPSELDLYSTEATGTLLVKMLYPTMQRNSKIVTMMFAQQAACCIPSVGQSETSFQASLNDKILVVKLRILYEDHEVIPAFTHCISVLALLGHAKYATEVRGSNMRVSTRKLRLTLRDFNQEGLFKCLDDSTISAGVEYGWHYNGDYALGFEPAGLASITKFFDILDAHESAKTLPYRSVSRLIDIPQDAHALGCSVGMTGNNILLFCQNVSVRCLCKN